MFQLLLDHYNNVRLCCFQRGDAYFLFFSAVYTTDAPDSRFGHDDHRRHADAPRSGRLRLRVL